jgi:hypothetical protein
LFGCPLGDLRLGFLWMNRAELHEDLERCLMNLSAEVDVGIVAHRAQQDSRA